MLPSVARSMRALTRHGARFFQSTWQCDTNIESSANRTTI
jgi:hypothetical protein